MNATAPRFLFLTALLLALSACRSVPPEDRAEHAREYLALAEKETADLLPRSGALGLRDCVRIALERNLDVRAATVARRLASLDRKIAFTDLLPHLDVQLGTRGSSDPMVVRFGALYAQTSDQRVTSLTAAARQPLFLPQAWYLYEIRRRGEDIRDLVTQRTKQMITLRVTALYYSCLSLDRVRPHLERAVEQARQLASEVRAFEEEGLATAAERAEIQALRAAREQALAENRRARERAGAELLSVMGLSPMAEVELEEPPLPEVTVRPFPDLVLEALLRRPELHAEDRAVEIGKDEIRMAISNFLPRVFGTGALTESSDSFLKYARFWTLGVSGILTVFDGFANLHRYEAAREREKAAFLDREQACLRVILEVVRSRIALDDARGRLKVAEQASRAAERRLTETEAQWEEGMVRLSDRLEAMSRRDRAFADRNLARYRVALAAATLRNVTGEERSGS